MMQAPTGIHVTVYRDHDAWDKHTRWFMLPARLLIDLFVIKYTIAHEEDTETGDTWPIHPQESIDKIETAHPNCIFVYT